MHCETPADTRVLCLLPWAEGTHALHLCSWQHVAQQLAHACCFAQMEPIQGAPRAVRQGGPLPTYLEQERARPACKAKLWPAGRKEQGWQRCQPPRSPGPIIGAHRSLWPQLNEPGCNELPAGVVPALPLRQKRRVCPSKGAGDTLGGPRPREGGAAEGWAVKLTHGEQVFCCCY